MPSEIFQIPTFNYCPINSSRDFEPPIFPIERTDTKKKPKSPNISIEMPPPSKKRRRPSSSITQRSDSRSPNLSLPMTSSPKSQIGSEEQRDSPPPISLKGVKGKPKMSQKMIGGGSKNKKFKIKFKNGKTTKIK